MNKIKSIAAAALLGLVIMAAGLANAAVYEFSGTVTLCTGTCASFASLDLGTQVSGHWEINTTSGGAWGFADVGSFDAEVLNPAAPLEPFNGTNPTTANPLPLTAAVAPIVAAGGGLTTGGTTNAVNALQSGSILHEFIVPPFNSNGAWLIFDIGPGGATTAQMCLFFPIAGCIPGATEAVVIDGQFTLIGVADTDDDGWADNVDNCVAVANNDQRDTDGDAIGNLCDADVVGPTGEQDCLVNFLDLSIYQQNFFLIGDFDTDNNGDNVTNFLDLLLVREQLFGPPGPSATGCDSPI